MARDPVELEPGREARSIRAELSRERLLRQIVADVAVELAVDRIAGIASLPRPHVPRRVRISREKGDAVLMDHRRGDPETRARAGEREAVGVKYRVPYAGRSEIRRDA